MQTRNDDKQINDAACKYTPTMNMTHKRRGVQTHTHDEMKKQTHNFGTTNHMHKRKPTKHVI